MKKVSLFVFMIVINGNLLFSQIAINDVGAAPDASAGLDIFYTNKGILIPRLTIGQRDAIANPADGLMIFCTNCGTDGSLSIFSNGSWKTYSSCSCSAPGSDGNHELSPGQITWNWNTVDNVNGYKWNTVNDYTTAIDMELETSRIETGTVCDTIYNRYIWAYNNCAASPVTLLVQSISESSPPSPIAAELIPSEFQIIWNWNDVSGSYGYKWNTINDITSAQDMGNALTHTEAGLSCGTSFTRYVWSYNDCGYSNPCELSQSTSACFVCGATIIKNHIAGNVAPENKSTSYGTVSGVPGTGSKCWITSNLGSTHQANDKADTTEASAGWYWQFNQMQGYKHNGITRTPNGEWITFIDEYGSWNASNDPCSIELGIGWRLPTATEYSQVDAGGSWVGWIGPWTSLLKMHAAGFIDATLATLASRGAKGNYWSSSQSSYNHMAMVLYFNSINCSVSMYSKAYGYSARCIRE